MTEKTKPPVEEPVAVEEERLHPILSNEEVLAARASAKKKIEGERVKAAKKAVEEAEVERLRVEEGLTTGDGAKDETVSITLDLAEHSPNITLSGRAYWHGYTYTVPRHVADTLAEIQFRGWVHQNEIDGKSRLQFYQKQRATQINTVTGAVKNAPQTAG